MRTVSSGQRPFALLRWWCHCSHLFGSTKGLRSFWRRTTACSLRKNTKSRGRSFLLCSAMVRSFLFRLLRLISSLCWGSALNLTCLKCLCTLRDSRRARHPRGRIWMDRDSDRPQSSSQYQQWLTTLQTKSYRQAVLDTPFRALLSQCSLDCL